MNLLQKLHCILISVSFVLVAPAAGAAESLQCPAALKVQELASSPASEWSVRIGEALRPLTSVSFHSGSPDEHNRLPPATSTRSGQDRRTRWRFGSKVGTVWIACRYRDTGITLTKRLPAAYRHCSVRTGAGTAAVTGIECG